MLNTNNEPLARVSVAQPFPNKNIKIIPEKLSDQFLC